MKTFEPDYTNLQNAARNIKAKRIPLYEHGISHKIMGELLGEELVLGNTESDINEFFQKYCGFFKRFGYDTVTFELCVTSILPGGGALSSHIDPAIKSAADFDRYPFDEIEELYFKTFSRYFNALAKHLPAGMKAVGGIGNGVFEFAQDLCGFENLMLISYDNPELYAALFKKIGGVLARLWRRFMLTHGDTFCVLRFGDDLGYKSNTMLPHDDIRRHIIPQYRRVVDIVHFCNKPFLFHSCGCIFDVFDDIIAGACIDSKHSNEDVIAPFQVWIERYGNRIGNFGGIDTDRICRKSDRSVREVAEDVLRQCKNGTGGFAIGTGNSVPDYADAALYCEMVETVRKNRGDY